MARVAGGVAVNAPFPFFGGKRDIAAEVWARLGTPRQYIEPFCGSAAILLAAPSPAPLEVVGDVNGFIANLWRATIYQPTEVARWADYPVSHVDLGARHVWLMEQRERLAAELQVHDWPGDAQVAGYWLWGQAAWIGSGWCEWSRQRWNGRAGNGQIPHLSDADMGIQAIGKIPHVSDAGRGVQAIGKIPHVSDAGRAYWTTGGLVADRWLRDLAKRLERVRVIHGNWDRCLNHHYGGDDTAVFLDPPYDEFEGVYHASAVAQEVAAWCRDNEHLRIALCGHRGDYDLPGWTVMDWERSRPTYGGSGTKAEECIWFSPACLSVGGQATIFDLVNFV